MVKNILRSKLTFVFLAYFLFLFFWWLKIALSGVKVSTENHLFNFSYTFIALFGALYGLYVAWKVWGGFRSVIGRGLIFLSLGLLGEWFGSTIWSYFNIIEQVEVPYPSIADLGFFSIIPLYALAMIHFGRASGVRITIRSFLGALQAILIPAIMVLVSYLLFLRNIEIDWGNPVKLFLDFGYPGGEAITVSFGILAFSLSLKVLGGRMRSRIFYIVFAVVFQYITDYLFLYRSGMGQYYNAGFVDLLYAASFMIMSLGLVSFYDLDIGKLALAEVTAPTDDLYSRIILKIISEQRQIIGPLAITEALKVSNLKVDIGLSKVQIVGDSKQALENLIKQYEKLFGRASVEVCKRVSYDFIKNLPASEIPEFLRSS